MHCTTAQQLSIYNFPRISLVFAVLFASFLAFFVVKVASEDTIQYKEGVEVLFSLSRRWRWHVRLSPLDCSFEGLLASTPLNCFDLCTLISWSLKYRFSVDLCLALPLRLVLVSRPHPLLLLLLQRCFAAHLGAVPTMDPPHPTSKKLKSSPAFWRWYGISPR